MCFRERWMFHCISPCWKCLLLPLRSRVWADKDCLSQIPSSRLALSSHSASDGFTFVCCHELFHLFSREQADCACGQQPFRVIPGFVKTYWGWPSRCFALLWLTVHAQLGSWVSTLNTNPVLSAADINMPPIWQSIIRVTADRNIAWVNN